MEAPRIVGLSVLAAVVCGIAHNASYAAGALGGLALAVSVRWRRGKRATGG
jgi:hypothetical protein